MSIRDLAVDYADARERAFGGPDHESARVALEEAITRLEREHSDLVVNHRVVCKALGLCDYADGQGYLYAYPDEVHAALTRLVTDARAMADTLAEICRGDRWVSPEIREAIDRWRST